MYDEDIEKGGPITKLLTVKCLFRVIKLNFGEYICRVSPWLVNLF
jgi:hypothetical protein